eukprot:CAMPEP_0174371390 /NCGR_PEP_ID=MMETSP0811_2-20130205/99580_1 /TAXON_ID=73025 ORGANISM="Eutreptiella gymnastica-like, Strain CCMP1594" /NCGR_SAMPLE_ID=MMETSP0811_2 /ASSEMBLY_ACC=CAM_ASM_000667 /LENGTH=62 /DNA_ID=CAMNT_0015517715 /DNA_START=184 /DNA_END=369 /DNA_ORIENTATION=+
MAPTPAGKTLVGKNPWYERCSPSRRGSWVFCSQNIGGHKNMVSYPGGRLPTMRAPHQVFEQL